MAIAKESKKLSVMTGRMIPSHIRDSKPEFETFVKGFFGYLEQKGNPYDIIAHIFNYGDIDDTVDEYVVYFSDVYTSQIPETISDDFRLLVKNIRQYYRAKGTEEGFKFLLRFIFNTESTFYYPKENILKPSSASWRVPTYLRVDPLRTAEELQFYADTKVEGATTGATAFVEKVEFAVNPDSVSVLQFRLVESTVRGTFQDGEDLLIIEANKDVSSYVVVATDNISNTVGAYTTLPGDWDSPHGIVSGEDKIQDNHFYQDFSYVLVSEVSLKFYKDIVKDILHPSGFIIFGELQLSDDKAVPVEALEKVINETILRLLYENNVIDVKKSEESHTLAITKESDVLSPTYEDSVDKLQISSVPDTEPLTLQKNILCNHITLETVEMITQSAINKIVIDSTNVIPVEMVREACEMVVKSYTEEMVETFKNTYTVESVNITEAKEDVIVLLVDALSAFTTRPFEVSMFNSFAYYEENREDAIIGEFIQPCGIENHTLAPFEDRPLEAMEYSTVTIHGVKDQPAKLTLGTDIHETPSLSRLFKTSKGPTAKSLIRVTEGGGSKTALIQADAEGGYSIEFKTAEIYPLSGGGIGSVSKDGVYVYTIYIDNTTSSEAVYLSQWFLLGQTWVNLNNTDFEFYAGPSGNDLPSIGDTSCSDDGSVVVCTGGQSTDQTSTPDTHITVFRYNGGNFSNKTQFYLGEGNSQGGATEVSMSADGDSFMIMNYTFDVGFKSSCYLFEWDGFNWIKNPLLLTPDTNQTPNGSFLSRDGNTIIFRNAFADFGGVDDAGSIKVFQKQDNLIPSNWLLIEEFGAPVGRQYSSFGSSMDSSEDGTVLFISDESQTVNGIANAGEVHVYDLVANSYVLRTTIHAPDINDIGVGSQYFGYGVATNEIGDEVTINALRSATRGGMYYLKLKPSAVLLSC